MMQHWTDDRLDDLSQQMDAGFERVDANFKRIDDDVRELRGEMNARFEHMETKFDSKLDGLQRTLFQIGGGIIAALLGVIATQL